MGVFHPEMIGRLNVMVILDTNWISQSAVLSHRSSYLNDIKNVRSL